MRLADRRVGRGVGWISSILYLGKNRLKCSGIDAWDNKVGEFYPYAGIPHGEDGVKHGLQMTAADTLINIIAERFQVDIGSIEVWQQVGQRFLTHITCCDEDVPESSLMRQTDCIDDVFYIGKRFGIGIGDAWAVVFQTK